MRDPVNEGTASGSLVSSRIYMVDPCCGDDSQPAGCPWKSISKINGLKLSPGDKVIIGAGTHDASFIPSGEGTAEHPISVDFLAGTHIFSGGNAIRLPMFVSNSSDDPYTPKPIGILLRRIRHIHIKGAPTERSLILCADRMVQIFNDQSEDVTYSHLAFDLQRPTVSEFRVVEAGLNSVVVQIAEGSDYGVESGRFFWKGDIGSGLDLCQEYDLASGRCVRRLAELPWASAAAEDLGGRCVRFTYSAGTSGLFKDLQVHHRKIGRDSVGVHNADCKNIRFYDCQFYALSNMGFVSQFTENIVYQRVNVVPPDNSIRTCPAWGDVFHFSNCKGDILVDSCRMSGMQDDAINCHGTHLRIIQKVDEDKLVLRFMQPQTYGFPAYRVGDEVAVIQHATLREHASNPRRKVLSIERVTDWDWLVTLDGPAPYFEENDVVDNITWYPNLQATNNHVSVDPVRGFLLTTRGKVLIERNTFYRCGMAGLLIEDDAEGWFESGPVCDMIVRGNRFVDCGIEINPQTKSEMAEEPVHENIRIEGNVFENAGISARSVRGLIIKGNTSPSGRIGISLSPSCSEVRCDDNDGLSC